MVDNFSSSKMTKMLHIDTSVNISKGIILPETTFRQIWDLVLFGATAYYTISIPFFISFAERHESTVCKLLIDSFFVADFYARLQHFAVYKDGILVTSSTEFRKLYVSDHFFIDALSLLPVSYAAWAFSAVPRIISQTRLIQFLRVCHLSAYLDNLIETWNSRTKFTISTQQVRTLQMAFLVLIFCHWFACAFHLLEDCESLNETESKTYLRSLFWSVYTGKLYSHVMIFNVM